MTGVAVERHTFALVNGAGDFGARVGRHLGALGAELSGGGEADAYVHIMSAGIAEDRLLANVDRAAWDAGAEAPIRDALAAMQTAFAALHARGGSVVVVIPTIALTGAAGLVPLASAAEGVRLMGKAAARAWGKHGIRVNMITAPVAEWVPEVPDEHAVPSKQGAALGGDEDLAAEVAGLVALLSSPLAAGVTGATIGVDRGTVLAP